MSSRGARLIVTACLTLVTVLAVGIVAYLAVQAPGYASTSVRDVQRAAWVTSSSDGMVGLLNQQTDEIQSPVIPDGTHFDLLQREQTVVVYDTKQHSLQSLDTASALLSGKLRLPEHFDLALSQSTVAVTDTASGDLWVLPTVGLGSGDLTTTKPTATTTPGAVVTVAGQVATVVAPGSDQVTTVTAGGDGPPQARTSTLPGGPLSPISDSHPHPVSITSVGDRPVVVDAPAGRVVTPDGSIEVPDLAGGAVVQQPGPANPTVLIATRDRLLTVDLTAGRVESLPIEHPGRPTAPVRVDECVYAAWAATAAGDTSTYLADCNGSTVRRDITDVSDSGRLVFRVNGSTVVLNDTVTGNVWVLDDDLTLVNNWDSIKSAQRDLDSGDSDIEGRSTSLSNTRENCANRPAPPTAADDEYGVRPGRPSVLRVMDNDGISSCSVTVISQVTGPGGPATTGDADPAAGDHGPGVAAADAVPDSVSTQIVEHGAAIQVTLPAGATEPITIGYTVDDGLGNTATAQVTVTPVSDADPVAPEKIRDSVASVTVGGTIAQNVLDDWISPSGDPLYLVGATSSVPDDRISYSPDGVITVVDTGTTGATKKTVSFTVSDGTHRAEGELIVDVVDEGKATPVASAVYATGLVGRPIGIRPLDSVVWPGSEAPVLSKVAPQRGVTGVSVVTDPDTGEVTVSAPEPGSYYLDYRVSVGRSEARGVIRVDVREPDERSAPVLTTDVVYLPRGGSARVDLTGNDVAPGGGIIAVQQIATDSDSGLVIQGRDMHLADISTRRSLPPEGAWVPYTASAGGPSGRGWLHVVEVPPPSSPPSPIASPITVSVRAGDAITIPVADHATDPAGGVLTPEPFPSGAIGEGSGLLFTTPDSIRYMAPKDGPVAAGKTIRTQYTVESPAGTRASANLAITVVPGGSNADPTEPATATARVFAGDWVDIPLPTSGIDPDGDWAIITGLDDPPTAGAADVTGTASIRYTAFDRPGTDSFSYTVSDGRGGTTTGRVEVLVVPLPDTVEAPVAPDLEVTVAPEKSVAVNVLGEVTDPGGLALSFPDDPFQLPGERTGIDVSLSGDAMLVRAGPAETTVAVRYTVQNERKRTGTGTVTVKVRADAPPLPPRAADVLIGQSMVNEAGTAAVVDVSPFVSNPGGLPKDLRAVVPAVSGNRLDVEGARTLTVPIADRRQVVAYRVTNAENLSAEAFLVVPSKDELNIDPPPPSRGQQVQPDEKDERDEKPEVFKPQVLKALKVDAGTTATIKIADYVGGTRKGRTVTVPESATLKVTSGTLTRIDAATLAWKVPDGAGGAARLTVTVGDGVGKPAKASIQATITPKKPDPPKFQGTEVQVEPGGTSDPVTLTDLVTYQADRMGKLTFSDPSGGGGGVTARVTDGVFTVHADAAVGKGTEASFTVRVDDGINPPVPATFTATVIGSTKPLATVVDSSVTTPAGEAVSINVLEGSTNPFDAEHPLQLIDVAGGDGYQVAFDTDGTVTVTPGADVAGDLTIGFTVGDASDDPDRYVGANLTVTVLGTPDSPGVPTVMSVGDSVATVQWTVPADNGSAITGYTVSDGNGYHQDCAQTPCTLEGLTNDVNYRFRVVAHNEVGDSDPSSPSAQIRPDTSPQAPAAPSVDWGDGTLSVSWAKPANTGSPISGYRLQLVPAPDNGPGTVEVPASAHQHRFEGLDNGTRYTVKVQAVNAASTPGDWSPAAGAVPAGAPGRPGKLTVSAADAAGENKQIDVSWSPATANGDAPHYVVTWQTDTGTSGSTEVPAGTTGATIGKAELGVAYTVSVTAVNKAGESDPATAEPVSPYTAPATVTDLAAVATGTDGEVTLSWSPPADNGRPITTYMYDDGSGWRDVGGTQTTLTVPGLSDGTEYAFRVRACNTDGGGNCGPGSGAVSAVPYGPPGEVPDLTVDEDSAAGQLTLSWGAADGNGRPVAGYQWAFAGSGQWNDAGDARSVVVKDLENGTEYPFVVRAYNAEKTSTHGGRGQQVSGTPYAAPAEPADLSAYGNGADNSMTIKWTDGSDGGRSITGYEYTTDGGKTHRAVSNGGDEGTVVTVDSAGDTLDNGTNYDVQVRALTDSPARNTSAWSAVDVAHPYGPYEPPTISASRSGNTVTMEWDVPTDGNGRDVKERSVVVTVDGDSQSVDVDDGSWSKNVGYNATVEGSVTFCVGDDDCKTDSDSVSTPEEPDPAIDIVRGDPVSNSECNIRCNYIAMNYDHFDSGTYTWTTYIDGEAHPQGSITLRTSGHEQSLTYAGDKGEGNPYYVKIKVWDSEGDLYAEDGENF